jgi:hypothetical protein
MAKPRAVPRSHAASVCISLLASGCLHGGAVDPALGEMLVSGYVDVLSAHSCPLEAGGDEKTLASCLAVHSLPDDLVPAGARVPPARARKNTR